MSATVKNVSKHPVVLVLDHPAFANKDSGWRRGVAKFANTSELGGRTVTEVRRSYPGVITLMPGESVGELHPAIQKCSQVPALVARKVLAISHQDDKPTATQPTDDGEEKRA